MKKVLVLLLSFAMVAVMAGCGAPEEEQPEETEERAGRPRHRR